MEQQGFTVKDVSWNMMKYSMIPTKRGKKMVLRNELTDDEFEEAYVYYPLSDESKNRCKEWVIETIEMIESKDMFDTWETNCDEPFFCTNLCSFCGKCSKGKELRDNYFRNRFINYYGIRYLGYKCGLHYYFKFNPDCNIVSD